MDNIWILYTIPYFLIIIFVFWFMIIISKMKIDIEYLKSLREYFSNHEKEIKHHENYLKNLDESTDKAHAIVNKRLETLEVNAYSLRKPLNNLANKLGYQILFPFNEPELVKVDEVKND